MTKDEQIEKLLEQNGKLIDLVRKLVEAKPEESGEPSPDSENNWLVRGMGPREDRADDSHPWRAPQFPYPFLQREF